MYYPQSPQIVHEMVISFLIHTKEIVWNNSNKKNFNIMLVPSDYYIFAWSVISSGYNFFMKNKRLKKIIIVWSDPKVKWFNVPNYSYINNILGRTKICSWLSKYFDTDFFKRSEESELNIENINCQIPFILTSMKIDCIFPIIVGETQKYIKLVNTLKEILTLDDSVWVIFSWNLSNNNKKNKDNLISESIINYDIKNLKKINTDNYIILKSFSLLSKKMKKDINPILYSNSQDLWADFNRSYFSMIS